MARLLALCSLPRTDPGSQLRYIRRNGPYTLYMTAGGGKRLPYGNLPRLLLAWVCSEAVRTQSRELVLGRSLSEFMRSVGVYDDGGAVRRRLRNQMQRLFRSHMELVYQDAHGERFVNSAIADRGEFWWDTKHPDQPSLWESKIELGEQFFHEVITNPVPLDMNILKAVKRSPLGLDLYLWLTYRTFALARPLRLTWPETLPTVRRGPGEGEQSRPAGVPPGLPARVEKNQGRLAGPALPDGQGRVAALAITAAYRAVATAARGIALKGKPTVAAIATLLVFLSLGVFLWAVVGLIRPELARLPNRASSVGVWILSVVLLSIGGDLTP